MTQIPGVIDLASSLLRLDSVNPPGRESALVDELGPILEASGFVVDKVDHGLGRASLIAILRGRRQQPPVVLSGHLDTVPLGAVAWKHDPFAGRVVDGRLSGRGASDMKGAVAAMTVAACRSARRRLGGDLIVVLTADEEVGGIGADALTKHQVFPDSSRIIIGEPTAMQVGVAQKRSTWLEVRFTGRAAHGAYPMYGASAIHAMVKTLPMIELIPASMEPHPVLGMGTVNVAMVGGGSAPNMVADTATAVVDFRLAPAISLESLLAAMHDALRRGAVPGVEAEVIVQQDRPGFEVRVDDPLVAAALNSLSSVGVTGAKPIGLSYFTEASVFQEAGEHSMIIVGPGDQSVAHQVDEFVQVDVLGQAAEFYEDLVGSLL